MFYRKLCLKRPSDKLTPKVPKPGSPHGLTIFKSRFVLHMYSTVEFPLHEMISFTDKYSNGMCLQSKQCCGVITYHDYEDFWPNTPTKIPRSCCRDRKNPVDPCPSDLTKIPYPDTPDIYFKVETGCMDEINEATRRNIRESFYHSMTMSIVIGIGLLVLLMAYVQQFLNKDKDKSKNTTGGEQGAGDAVVPVSSQSNNFISDSEALMIDSNGQMIASIESIAPLATYESMPQQVPQFQQQPVQAPLQQPQPTQSSSIPPQSSNARFNKVNAVFAGLQQTSGKFPEASTGDDMTVGGSNIGRREVFVAQDNKPSQQIPPTQSNQQQQPQQQNSKGERGNFASSSSGDEFADDVIRDDQDPGGQASGRKKKGRKHKRRNSSDYGNDS